jgi:predicted kinase
MGAIYCLASTDILGCMSKNVLIIVSGLPATGKTTLSKGIAESLKLPLLSKDEIKEILFDDIGHGDRGWGEKLNIPTYNLLNHFVEQELRAGRSVVIESPYDDDFPCKTYEAWQAKYNFVCLQVICFAQPNVLIDRFTARIDDPDRHPGHNDEAAFEDFKRSIKSAGKIKPLSLRGEIYELDTTNFDQINTKSLLKKLEVQITSRSSEK